MRLVEADLEASARAALARTKATDAAPGASPRAGLEVLHAALAVRLGRARRVTAARLAELFELPADDVVGIVADWLDARVQERTPAAALVEPLADLQAFFDVCAEEGLGPVDLRPLRATAAPKARVPLPAGATRDERMAWLLKDPYTRTVMRRLAGIAGAVPTDALLRAIQDLALTPDDEPLVGPLLASLADREVSDAHAEIVEPLRAMRARR